MTRLPAPIDWKAACSSNTYRRLRTSGRSCPPQDGSMTSFSLCPFSLALTRALMLFALVAAGCASATVTPQQAAAPVKTSRPRTVYVRNFAVVAEDVKESHGIISQGERKFSSTPEEQRQMEIGHSAATELSNQLAKDLRALGFNVEQQIGEVPGVWRCAAGRGPVHQCR